MEHFAHNLKDWIDSFVVTFTKMQANGYSEGQLTTQNLDLKFFTQYDWNYRHAQIGTTDKIGKYQKMLRKYCPLLIMMSHALAEFRIKTFHCIALLLLNVTYYVD